MIRYDKAKFIEVCRNADSMAQAAATLKLHFNTFKRHAILLGCYNPNQAGKGISKLKPKIPLEEILNGQHPSYQTFKLKQRLFEEDVFQNVCSECGVTDWNGRELEMELDHIDGNRTNHCKNNLRLLCPNCHAQTGTHRAKNKSLNREIC